MARILIVEDESDILHTLDYNLRQAGHEVHTAARGQEGLAAARRWRPDLILLDLMLPDIPGTEVCKAIRQDAQVKDVAVVMLTARSEEVDRVVGFELGADDYVAKPFSVRELLLRVQAILRRREPPPTTTEGPIDFGVLRVDRASHRAWVEGGEVELTALEFKLLVTLFDRKDRVQSRATLLADVWEMRGGVETRTVDTHVKRLREKLGAARDYIETVRGAGYRFAARPAA
jgi:two-component system, OmpR family, phosphate regulon response regulator PhoB